MKTKKLLWSECKQGGYLEGALLGWNRIEFDYSEQREDT